jgi:uncharacterized protein YlxW (UPF0749 family)
MQLKGLLKRVIPFFLTFALGLLVASFFVSVAAPNFSNFKRKNCRDKHRENYRLRSENDWLQNRVRQLEQERMVNDLKFRPNLMEPVPPPPPMPVPPRVVK